jgi:hypothetical protein
MTDLPGLLCFPTTELYRVVSRGLRYRLILHVLYMCTKGRAKLLSVCSGFISTPVVDHFSWCRKAEVMSLYFDWLWKSWSLSKSVQCR